MMTHNVVIASVESEESYESLNGFRRIGRIIESVHDNNLR